MGKSIGLYSIHFDSESKIHKLIIQTYISGTLPLDHWLLLSYNILLYIQSKQTVILLHRHNFIWAIILCYYYILWGLGKYNK